MNQIQPSWTNSCAATVIEKEYDLLDKIEDLSEDKIKSPPITSGGFCFVGFSVKLSSMKYSAPILIIGIWLIVSPWVLQFYSYNIPTWNAVIVGIISVILSFSRINNTKKKL